MELELNKKYELVAKVVYFNTGDSFKNCTVETEDGTQLNIKLNAINEKIVIGNVYLFKTTAIQKKENELALFCNLVLPLENNVSVDEYIRYLNVFFNSAPMKITAIKEEIEKYLNKITNPVLKKICRSIYKTEIANFYLFPAGKTFHHAYIGGLSYHTLSMLKASDAYIKIYPILNKDLVYAGIILHDICKTKEYSRPGGDFSVVGHLIGHLTMGTNLIHLTAFRLGLLEKEEVLLLEHIVVSHHGITSFGSLKKPQIPEALLIWYLDTIDTKFSELNIEIAKTNEGEFTDSIPAIDKTRFYKSKITKEEK
ncbi:MAG: HD domain-containing protein [Acholeplasmatales bacterium]|jgi:3'-5' exoribonuclease|nr:HD domain-containing protein [Acholeplasmatales bacterium]